MDRESLNLKATVAAAAERFDDMTDAMKQVASIDGLLSAEERDLFVFAYINKLNGRRRSWNAIVAIEQEEEHKGLTKKLEITQSYRFKVEDEIIDICEEVVALVDDHLMPGATTNYDKVFSLKLNGDFCRFLAEFSTGTVRTDAVENSLNAYKEGWELAKKDMSPANPARLALALGYSLLLFDILQAPEQACQMAKKVCDDARADLDNLSDEDASNSALIMEMMDANRDKWMSDMQLELQPDEGH